jgi:hypothetical protein
MVDKSIYASILIGTPICQLSPLRFVTTKARVSPNWNHSSGLSCAWAKNAIGDGAPPTLCLPVANDLFLLVFGLVETIEDLLASPPSCSLDDLAVYWDTLSWRHLLRNLHVDFYPCPKSALASTPLKFERASELVGKVFTSSRVYLHWYLLNAESALMAWFWRIFILLFAQWRSSTWVFGLQVKITGWPSKVRLGLLED